MNKGPDHYRYYTSLTDSGVSIHCERFVVIGETERCYYVITADYADIADRDFKTLHPYYQKLRKRVLKRSHKRYCYPDRKQALQSFIARQSWREKHAKQALSQAKLAGDKARLLLENVPTDNAPIKCGHDDYTSSLRWIEL